MEMKNGESYETKILFPEKKKLKSFFVYKRGKVQALIQNKIVKNYDFFTKWLSIMLLRVLEFWSMHLAYFFYKLPRHSSTVHLSFWKSILCDNLVYKVSTYG